LVVAATAINDIVQAVALNIIVQAVACHNYVGATHDIKHLHISSQGITLIRRVKIDIVIAFIGIFDHNIAGTINIINVAAHAAIHCIVASAAVNVIIACQAVNQIIADPAGNSVIAVGAYQGIIAGRPGNGSTAVRCPVRAADRFFPVTEYKAMDLLQNTVSIPAVQRH